ncbi:MAG: DMT family transporter [Roseofilum sp. SID2]|uniref:DMT family transporter n=1 Tax=unclassified Roseofilum TaxID=2620099 RepID=UPI001B0F7E61|nr:MULTISPECIES: DMT family transporter [unclassified Roseofilum]MBP0014665.1 DMT family transporter [Roseofilum sp. SID3]MBP0023349.1 DMT family transporter [Roseofilum sp. SID2]MBP0039663.1 DMT family transporter [Roseofilum sp. SID1]
MRTQSRWVGWCWASICILLWGSAFPGVRYVVQTIHPLNFVAFRFLIASLGLAVFAMISGKIRRPHSSDLPRLLLQGCLGVSFYHLLLSWGQTVVPAGTASILNASSPCIAAILAATILKESLPLQGWLGMALGLGGIVLIVLGKGQDLTFALSSGLILMAAFSQGFYFVLQRPFFERYSPLELASYTVWLGTLPILFFVRFPDTLKGGLVVGYLGIFPGAIAYIAWTYTLAHLSTAQASSFLYLVPIIATAIAWLVLGEPLTLTVAIAGAMILMGVFWVNQSQSKVN